MEKWRTHLPKRCDEHLRHIVAASTKSSVIANRLELGMNDGEMTLVGQKLRHSLALPIIPGNSCPAGMHCPPEFGCNSRLRKLNSSFT